MTEPHHTGSQPETAGRYASVGDRLAAQQRRKRARLRLTMTVFIISLLTGWAASDMLLPDVGKPNLSAKPAPADAVFSVRRTDTAPMQRRHTTDTLASGDTLAQVLARAGINSVEADAALDALRGTYDVRRLKPGQTVRVFREWPAGADTETAAWRFAGLDFIPEPRQRVSVRRTGHMAFEASRQDRPLTTRHFLADSLISSSVYEAARGGGMAPNLVVELIRLFSFSIDFQRDIREGDQLEVMYTRRFDENNQLAEEGDIVFAALTNRGKRLAYWRLAHADGAHGFYDADGRSVQRLLMKTPVDGARLSSQFGMRRHPILGYTRMHRGLDFAAPRGTPIYAAGDGTVTSVANDRNFGKHMKIRHRNGYETVYAHMHRFGRGIRTGARVKQGQIIGTVGSTGLATGPHLHYEVRHYKRAINPRELNVPARNQLTQQQMQQLADVRAAVDNRLGALAASDNSLRSLPRRRLALRP